MAKNVAGLLALMTLCALSISLGSSAERKTIDQLIAAAGHLKHGKAKNSNGNGAELAGSAHAFSVSLDDDDTELIEYDIRVHKKRKGNGSRRKRRNAVERIDLWPNGIIPYTLDTTAFDTEAQELIQSAIDEFRKYTCIRLIPWTNEENYLMIKDLTGCWSYAGRERVPQEMSLQNPGCLQKEVIIHEFMHATGVFHEHNREDRDDYVTIVPGNIEEEGDDQFKKTTGANTYDSVYSYTSIMHYGRDTYSKNEQDTIITKDPKYQEVIGQSLTFSFEDLKLLNNMYQCGGKCGARCPKEQYLGADCMCHCSSDAPETIEQVCGTPVPVTTNPTTKPTTIARNDGEDAATTDAGNAREENLATTDSSN